MHKRLVALPGRQAAEHRRGGGREMVSISRVEGRTGDAARVPGVATSREVRAREPQPRTLQRGLAPPPAAVDGGVDGHRRARGGRPRLTPVSLSSRVDGVMEQRVQVTRALAESADAVPTHRGVLQQALKDGPRVGVAHAGMMVRVEAARMPQVAAVHQVGAHIRALRRRSLEHALLRVSGLAHVDDFKVMEVRAPLVIGAHAWSVENGVRHKALPAGPALVANGGGKQVGEEPVRLHAALHARAHSVRG